ncbi:hypothetical protein L083_4284 [Actinoplanes sp. N902-109]|nr:hypothetical protein L083_4284 [Actinoplanes sp. N902-109]
MQRRRRGQGAGEAHRPAQQLAECGVGLRGAGPHHRVPDPQHRHPLPHHGAQPEQRSPAAGKFGAAHGAVRLDAGPGAVVAYPGRVDVCHGQRLALHALHGVAPERDDGHPAILPGELSSLCPSTAARSRAGCGRHIYMY